MHDPVDSWSNRVANLALGVARSNPGQDCQIYGRLGAGKTRLLKDVARRVADESLIPIFLAPPRGDEDTAPAALVRIADSLEQHALFNGHVDTLTSLEATWQQKLDLTVNAINGASDRLVLFCDEPRRWSGPDQASEAYSPYAKRHADDLLQALFGRASCRRVFTGERPAVSTPPRVHLLPIDGSVRDA